MLHVPRFFADENDGQGNIHPVTDYNTHRPKGDTTTF